MASEPDSQQPAAPLLLTPGPLTTSRQTRAAMLRDWGSRDKDFIELTARLRRRLSDLVGATDGFTTILLQGSGTFIIEAMIGTFTTPASHILILENGAYGRRAAEICARLGRPFEIQSSAENAAPSLDALAQRLARTPAISHVIAFHVETTSGILNPLTAIADRVRESGAALLVDAMSGFGGIPLNVQATPFTALAASSNKCLESAPGLGFVIAEVDALARTQGQAHSVSLDLYDQWLGLEANGQWRFTPPTHVAAALDSALTQLEQEGGVSARHRRYQANCRALRDGLANMGFQFYLPEALQAPIIVTVRTPRDPRFDFDEFYRLLHQKGFNIYPGKLTQEDSFRIGCIGAIDDSDIRRALAAIEQTLTEMGVEECGSNI